MTSEVSPSLASPPSTFVPRYLYSDDEVANALERLYPVGQVARVPASGLTVSVTMTPRLAASLARFVHLILRNANPTARTLIGLSGPAGAGKTTLCAMLGAILNELEPNSTVVLGMDGYHRRNDELDARGLRHLKGRPETLDIAKFVADLQRVKEQKPGDADVLLPQYNRLLHNPTDNSLSVPAPPRARLVLVEGILLYTTGHGFEPLFTASPELATAPLLDVRVYLDVPEAVARRRVNSRKVTGGRTHEEVEGHYLRVDHANHLEMDRGKQNAGWLATPEGGVDRSEDHHQQLSGGGGGEAEVGQDDMSGEKISTSSFSFLLTPTHLFRGNSTDANSLATDGQNGTTVN